MLGVDIVEIKRISAILERYGDRFLKKVFSDKEIKLYHRHKERDSFLAGRFAAKEAIIKAVGYYIPLQKIEILGYEKPFTSLSVDIDIDIKISISHTRKLAVAVAFISQSSSRPEQQHTSH